VLGGAVFGERPGAWATLRALPATPGLVASLVPPYRLTLARSFYLPVWHLERLRGREAWARARILDRRARGHAVWLTLGCVLFEMAMIVSLFGLIDLLTPEPYERRFGWEAMFGSDGDPWWQEWMRLAFYAGAVSVVEPLYVASGFALYLNRRTQLEAWDVELTLRRLEERSTAPPPRAAALAAALALLVALGWFAGGPSVARAAERSAADEIREVLREPAFEQYRESRSWRYIGPGFTWGDDEKPKRDNSIDWGNLGRLFAEMARALIWGVAGALLAAVIYYLARNAPAWRRGAATGSFTPPPALFGMDIRPESLPPDVPGAATTLIEGGALRDALSLLYRGTLSVLVHREGLPLNAGDTEHECLRKARARCTPPVLTYFARLVVAWQAAAYAARMPERAVALELCTSWRALFVTEAQ
jgi:hypothetical protein